ncbi:g8243 [Coccomyxa viridis]|uniref:Photosystem I reaction center subunit III n=1 Tax=Coccomyxa viridis TaxID=1274662 RepID=A0ABP1G4C9_9CHLO
MAATSCMTTRLGAKAPQQEVAFRGSIKPLRAVPVARRNVARAASCSAEERAPIGKAVAAAALAAALAFGSVEAAKADISGLTPCSESKGFAKRQKNELKALEKRLKKYEEGSAPALALKATMERTEKRFKNYGDAGLLCGTDGLPHLISDPGLALRYGHAGETLIPTVGFLYIAGWIGYVGRDYLIASKKESKPRDKEIIIDVPMALKMAFQGAGWPFRAFRELQAGTLLADDKDITVSPR